MFMMSNRLGLNASRCRALSGPDHQVTRPEMAPPQTAAAASAQPVLTASQRLRVTDCTQANQVVPLLERHIAPVNTPAGERRDGEPSRLCQPGMLVRGRCRQRL
jgi:hypothetical protein